MSVRMKLADSVNNEGRVLSLTGESTVRNNAFIS